jgi:hypothetical protein
MVPNLGRGRSKPSAVHCGTLVPSMKSKSVKLKRVILVVAPPDVGSIRVFDCFELDE